MTNALWIGRFQPLHNGHLDGAKQIEEDGAKALVVGIGSAQEKNTEKNPFTYDERRKMLIGELEKAINIPFMVFPIPDLSNDKQWTEYVLNNTPRTFQRVYSGNPHVQACFKDKEVRVLNENRLSISASTIREKIAKGEDISREVPCGVERYLNEIGAKDRLESLVPVYRNPTPTVDGIVEYEGGIVLVERKNPPHGWALPGGFAEYGISNKDNVVKEVLEETGLKFTVERLLDEYSDPSRDPRNHNITLAFVGKGEGELRADSDAKNAMVIDPMDAMMRDDIAFDHKDIIADYIRFRRGR